MLRCLLNRSSAFCVGIRIITSVLTQDLPPSFFPVGGVAEADADGYQVEVLPSLQVWQLGLQSTS